MDALKIKIEIGDRKFEADGPVDVVQAQVNAFMKLTVGGSAETLAAEAAAAERKKTVEEQKARTVPLDKILWMNDSKIFFRVTPRRAKDALLVLMLGQKQFRNNHFVAGIDLIQGLRRAGYRQGRADHFLNGHERRGYVTIEGKYRLRRYKLTDAGVQRAEQIVKELLAYLPPPAPPAPVPAPPASPANAAGENK